MDHVDLTPIIKKIQHGIINGEAGYSILSQSEVQDSTLEPNLTYHLSTPIKVVNSMGEVVIDEDSLTRNEVMELLHVKKLIAEKMAPQYRMEFHKLYRL